MSPDIFVDDFEITENTEELHAILGRCIIIATKFDNLCDHAAKFLGLKKIYSSLLSDAEFEECVNAILCKFSTLNGSINSLPLESSEKDVLHNARRARNEIAHNLSIGMTGCLDTKIDEFFFKEKVSLLVANVASGDFLISKILSILSGDPMPIYTEKFYQDRVICWVRGGNV